MKVDELIDELIHNLFNGIPLPDGSTDSLIFYTVAKRLGMDWPACIHDESIKQRHMRTFYGSFARKMNEVQNK